MKISKQIQGDSRFILVELEKIKEYPRFTLFQVYKYAGDKLIPLYKTSFTPWQLKDIVVNGYKLAEEVFE